MLVPAYRVSGPEAYRVSGPEAYRVSGILWIACPSMLRDPDEPVSPGVEGSRIQG
ncbi:MAG: hypothetical protein SNJ85_06645 [Cyanobacteriota bacterium]